MYLVPRSLGAVALLMAAVSAPAATLSFSKLSGVTGGTIANTAVFRADLSTLGSGAFASLVIRDGNVVGGTSPGRFTGFDLDAVIISSTLCTSAACVGTLSPTLLDYGSAAFTPGTQLAPLDTKLFGSGPTGSTVDATVATLSLFDGESSVTVPDGFISLGLGGSVTIGLLTPSTVSGLYLYVGEVGDNGELAGGTIELRAAPPVAAIPEPGTYALMLAGLGLVAWTARRRKA